MNAESSLITEEEIRKAAMSCTEWHACATGDCEHEKYSECFDAVFTEGARWYASKKAMLLIPTDQEIRRAADTFGFTDAEQYGSLPNIFGDVHFEKGIRWLIAWLRGGVERSKLLDEKRREPTPTELRKLAREIRKRLFGEGEASFLEGRAKAIDREKGKR